MLLPIKRILSPTDFSEPSYAALKIAAELAGHFKAALDVLHVIAPVPVISPSPETLTPGSDAPSYPEQLTLQKEKVLKDLLGKMVSQEIPTAAAIRAGEAVQEIVAYAAKEPIDLIVIASHGQSGWRRLITGSVTEQVVRLSPSPVLVIQEPRGEKPEK